MSSAKTKSGATYIVARYSNRGKVIGESAYGMTYKMGTSPALNSSEGGNERSEIFALSPYTSRLYEKRREPSDLTQLSPSSQLTRGAPGTSIVGSHGNVPDIHSNRPMNGAGDVATGGENGLSRVHSCQPVTGNKIQDQSTTATSDPIVGQHKVFGLIDHPIITNIARVRNIKNFIREIEEPIRKFSPRYLLGKEKTL